MTSNFIAMGDNIKQNLKYANFSISTYKFKSVIKNKRFKYKNI